MPRDKMNKHDTTSRHHILVGESKIQKKNNKNKQLKKQNKKSIE